MTFYLKYRPQKIADLDLASARDTLLALIKKGELPHAFLFAGPRGTGKTSSARILAKAINCEKNKDKLSEPCNECATCLSITKGTNIDVIEMDAASNRGIDEVRALKQDIMLAPSTSRKKIYIIDEVHMLTTEAANALLKTLEEPPLHVVFILATTDPQKLPQTVVSRLCVVPFHRATVPEITGKLAKIAKEEGIVAEDEVFSKVASIADGSFRDAVKIFEELAISGGALKVSDVESKFMGGVSSASALLQVLKKDDVTEALARLAEYSTQATDGKALLNALITLVHARLLKSFSGDDILLLELLLEAKSRLSYSPNEIMPIELALIKFGSGAPSSEERKKEHSLPKETPRVNVAQPESKAEVVSPVESVPRLEMQLPTNTVVSESSFDEGVWTKILVELRSRNAGVEALLRAAKPLGYDGRDLRVGVFFKFHKERLEIPMNTQLFETAAAVVLGSSVKISYVLEEPPVRNTPEVASLTEPAAPDIIDAAKQIFGN